MANDKDFLLKNAVEVGGSTKTTLGTITSGTVDLSTGNYFSETLAANTTYAFSNAGDVQSFQLEVTGGAIGYDLSSASYDSVSFNVSAQSPVSRGLFFKPDGTKFYTIDDTSVSVRQYSLSTAWDLTTASYESKTFSVSSQETAPNELAFSSDGTKMYITGLAGDDVNEYSLSTAWDVSTASYTTVFSVATEETSPTGLAFKSDGTKMYVVGPITDRVYQYTLSTAWDVSTASYDSVSFNVSGQETAPSGLAFSSNGTKMYIVGITGDDVNEYNLSTAWDISTSSFSTNFSVATEETVPKGLAFKDDGTKMYVVGESSDSVFQYSTSTPVTLTWPTSIEWAGGISPAAPATGETDIFTISTDDGGTTYQGFKTADNLS